MQCLHQCKQVELFVADGLIESDEDAAFRRNVDSVFIDPSLRKQAFIFTEPPRGQWLIR
jgi:hypothetical protein